MVFYCSGCRYPDDYIWISQPCSSFPSGGIFKKLPDYYQDYERERRKYEEKARRERDERERERWKEFGRRFAQGFFGFDDDFTEDQKDVDYPFSVFGLKKSASQEDMKKAYRKSIMETHPDKGGTNEAFRKVKEAYDYFKSMFVPVNI